MAKLVLNNITKRYHASLVIHGLSIEIQHGEMAVVVGPSGCGKSTLLRMIAGLEEVTSGEIHINNRIVNQVEPKNRNVAMVFQNYALYPHMTVYQNMAYGLRMRGFKKHEIADRVAKVATTLGLISVLNRTPKQLSGGQRQRVAMGRAMVREPDIFLFDEPLSNLDTQLRSQMRLEIKQLQQQLRTTSLYVTHDQIEAMTLADRLVVMSHGVIEQIGTPLEIYHRPATKFVAEFMGSPAMNFLLVTVTEDGAGIELPGGTVLLHQYEPLKKYKGDKIYLGIRPENYSLSSTAQPGTLQVTVEQIEALGSDTLVYCRLQNSSQMLVWRIPGHWQTNLNEVISLQLQHVNLHFFDADNGRI
jgi:sn-glycerol 3-phosphate transport system ATP-binding protein